MEVSTEVEGNFHGTRLNKKRRMWKTGRHDIIVDVHHTWHVQTTEKKPSVLGHYTAGRLVWGSLEIPLSQSQRR